MILKYSFRSLRASRSAGWLGAHHRPVFDFRSVVHYIFHSMGQWLYVLGTITEIAFRRIYKKIKHFLGRSFSGIGKAFAAFFVYVFRYITGFFADLFFPVVKIFISLDSFFDILKECKGNGSRYRNERLHYFFHTGWERNKERIGRMTNRLLPLCALTMCVLVVWSVSRLEYVLEVNYKGSAIGYVNDENTYNSARRLVKNRLVSDLDQTWTGNAELRLTVADKSKISSQETMAQTLIDVSGNEIIEATGLYVGGSLKGATTASDMLQSGLDKILGKYSYLTSDLGDDVTVKFKREVNLVPGIYPADTLQSIDNLLKLVNSPKHQVITYNAVDGELLSSIADINGVSVGDIEALNPGVGDVVTGDRTIVIAEDEPLLTVKTIRQIVEEITVRYNTKVIRDERLPVGYVADGVKGQNGVKTRITEIEYEDGEKVSEKVISEEMTVPVVNAQKIVGGRAGGGDGVGDYSLCWPVSIPLGGGGIGISRGWQANHNGVDIWAAYDTPLLAADDGVVIVSTEIPWDYGRYIILDHQDGMQTLYGHCSELLVGVGEVVREGQVIALMGSTGHSTGTHLHFEVRISSGGSYGRVDPNSYLHYWY